MEKRRYFIEFAYNGTSYHGWQKQPQAPEFADRLKRDLHTLKGGARMAGFNALGQYTHEFESFIDLNSKADKAFFAKLAEYLELIIGSYDIARAVAAGSDAAWSCEIS